MERCDFSSVMTIIRKYISEDRGNNQVDLLYLIFDNFMSSDMNEDFYFDNGQVCRWMNGQAKISPRINTYYMDVQNFPKLASDLKRNVLPIMYDSNMAVQELYELTIQDNSISEKQKQNLCQLYPCESSIDVSHFIAKILIFSMERNFQKRDSKIKNLLSAGSLSPMLSDYIYDEGIPNPCRHFCGREKELKLLQEYLTKHRHVFLHGIAGIGKSELAKAYAKMHRKDYTNILYLTYSGDLHQDVIDMDFADDLPDDSDEERFRKHNRFLRSLKEDTLIIVDNFNTTAAKDSFLSVMLKYRCRILFTTRSRMDGYPSLLLEEISDKEALFSLASHFYSDAESNRQIAENIIETVHSHTLAVELAARLLENGILEPQVLLQKLQEEKAALDSTDKIGITKDGKARKETYYGHIHTLFSLYQLTEDQQNLMQCMSFIPAIGIPSRLFASLLKLPDMNPINDLIEMGFIQPNTGHSIALHPLIQEITLADTKPSVRQCQTLCQSLQDICLLHGVDTSYYKLLFQIVENIMTIAEKDDIDFYLRFIEDVFPYMDKYQYENGMKQILAELDELLKKSENGTARDRALLFDYQAACEKKPEKSIKLEKAALDLLAEITADNAHLAANIHANLGALYHQLNNLSLAEQHMKQGLELLEKYQLLYTNDSIPQVCNYAALLTDLGEPEQGLSALKKLARIVKEYNSECCSDYAIILESMGTILLMLGKISEGTEYLKQEMQIYTELWKDAPEKLEAKYQEIANLYPQVGFEIAQRFLSNIQY